MPGHILTMFSQGAVMDKSGTKCFVD